MTTLKVLNDKFEDSSNLDVNLELGAKKINTATVHQVVKAIRAAKRTGTASTKTRAFVSGGGAKPYKQKGTGNARRGSSRSPLIKGGAAIFGPMPRDYTEKVNKKVSKMALVSVLADKYQSGHLLVMEKLSSNGKTKDLFKKLNDRGLTSSLMVVSSDSLVLRAAKNLQYAKAVPLNLFNVYNALKYEYLIIEKDELAKVVSRLG